MTTRCIKVGELLTFVQSEAFQKMAVIPISRHRALSHANNPRATPDDIALVLISEGETLLGYLGLLPDHIFERGEAHPVAWMSCIWVSPDARGKGVAKLLLKTGVEAWNGRLLATEFTAPAKKLYDKLDLFDPLVDKDGLRAYLRMNMAELMPKKNPRYAKLRWPLLAFDGLANLLIRLRLAFYPRLKDQTIRTTISDELDEETWQFIRSFQKKELCRRDKAAFDWMLQYPWVSSSPEAKVDSQRYHFSSYAKYFKLSILHVFQGQRLIGVFILNQRETSLKIPYAYFEYKDLNIIGKMITDLMLDHKISTLTVYQRQLCEYFKNSLTPFFHTRPFLRQYLISKSLDDVFKEEPVNLQDGDGDCGFT